MKRKRKIDPSDQFTVGFLLAAASVNRWTDHPGTAMHLMDEVGIGTYRDLRAMKLEDYDAKELRKVLRSEGRK